MHGADEYNKKKSAKSSYRDNFLILIPRAPLWSPPVISRPPFVPRLTHAAGINAIFRSKGGRDNSD